MITSAAIWPSWINIPNSSTFVRMLLMKTKIPPEENNLQTPGNPLSDKVLEKIVKTTGKGPFITLEEQNSRMKNGFRKTPDFVSRMPMVRNPEIAGYQFF